MIDSSKIKDGIIIHCETNDERRAMNVYLGRRVEASDNAFRVYESTYTKNLSYSTGNINYYNRLLGSQFRGYIVVPFKDILVPENLTRFKNSKEYACLT